MDWRLQPNDSDGYQDHILGVLSKQDGIRCGALEVNHYGGWRSKGGSGNDLPEPTSDLEH